MITPVYGELAQDGTHIRVSLGDDADGWAVKDMGTRLKSLTPAFAFPDDEPLVSLVPLSWAAVTQIASVFPNATGPDGSALSWTPGQQLCAWMLAETMRRSCKGDFLGEHPARTPMDHQWAGGLAIGMNGRFLLADEMGAGKSQSAAMGLAECAARGRNPWPALIVCPASVVDSWLEDLALVYPGWTAVAYTGPNRKRLLKSDARILVTSWETMRNDVGDSGNPGPLMKRGFKALVGDEMHKACNWKSKQSQRIRRLASHVPVVIEATGTPTNTNAGNFWPLLNGLFAHAFPSEERYKGYYCIGRSQDYKDDEVTGLNPRMEPEFRRMMQGTWRRVAKADVMKDLPPKTYQTRWVDIPQRYRAAYEGMRDDMLAEIPDTMTPLQANSTLAKMMRLSQLAHSACDVEEYWELDQRPDSETYGQEVKKIRVTMREPSWKVDALMEVLDELHEGDAPLMADGSVDRRRISHGSHPVVVFAPLKQLIMLAGIRAQAEGYRVGYIVGGMDNKQRTKARLAFQGNELDLLAVTTGAGGTGLTLTAAEAEVFIARPWSLIESSQAEDRGHRPGQKRSLMVIDLVTRNSIESQIRAALRDKAHGLAELVQDPRIARELLGGSSK